MHRRTSKKVLQKKTPVITKFLDKKQIDALRKGKKVRFMVNKVFVELAMYGQKEQKEIDRLQARIKELKAKQRKV